MKLSCNISYKTAGTVTGLLNGVTSTLGIGKLDDLVDGLGILPEATDEAPTTSGRSLLGEGIKQITNNY
jgi:hypothetical protein